MKKNRKQSILLIGFANDLEEVVSRLGLTLNDVVSLTEETPDAEVTDVPKTLKLVVYVISSDTGVSTHLRSIFDWVYHEVPSTPQFLLPIGTINLTKTAFPEISHVPQISISDLKNRLELGELSFD